ncbi:MAG: UDP-N-acetylmuramoyl-tripeptide--D-alanyl-D-alanine ligase [Bdellovibrionales bacterium]|nr:UDP-N-acetylmuramoyl-tripeptide--D-alanyl-D-alanine ligase [Bdellovibrionales bacterium]
MPFAWTTSKIASILHITPQAATSDAPISEIITDSRAIKPDCLFVAIKGDQFDGHDFIGQAIQKGAAAILTEKPVENPGKAAIFQVQSSMASIRKLAQAFRESFSIPVIAVVGAVGKTTTKELLSSILLGKYVNVLKTEGSLNGFLGIPLTLLRLQGKDQIAVVEIGIDEIGAMEQHLAVVQPTHVILTANGPEHLHQLKTVEIAASEELKALDYALTREKPMAINLNDEFVLRWYLGHATRLRRNAYVTYCLSCHIPIGVHPDLTADYSAADSRVQIHLPGGLLSLASPIPGEHHAHNLLAAVSMATFFEITPEQIQTGLQTFKTAFGRTELYTLPNGAEVIGDYYNSNPTSVKAALQLLQSRATGHQTHAVLGDMLELGSDEELFHRALAPVIRATNVKSVWLFGARMKWLQDELKKQSYNAVQHFDTHDALVQTLKPAIKDGDHVLIKGSRGMKMEKVLEPLIGNAAAGKTPSK